MLVSFMSHLQGMIGELVMAVLACVDGEDIRTRPVLPINDWVNNPLGVSLIVNGEVSGFFRTYSSSEIKNLTTQIL